MSDTLFFINREDNPLVTCNIPSGIIIIFAGHPYQVLDGVGF